LKVSPEYLEYIYLVCNSDSYGPDNIPDFTPLDYRTGELRQRWDCRANTSPVSFPENNVGARKLMVSCDRYSLLLQVLSAPGIITLYDSALYLLNGKARPRAPSNFSVAVILGLVVHIISSLVGVADLWLHSTTSAVMFNLTAPESSSTPLWTSLAFNQSICREDESPGGPYICMGGHDKWAEGNEFLTLVGQNVISNTSFDRKVITLADAEDLSVVVPLTIGKLATFKATSFGTRARCKSLNPECGGQQLEKPVNCSSLGITAIPSKDTNGASVVLVAPYDKWDDPPLELDAYPRFGPIECCTTNPVQSQQLTYRS
jgi:hypothetical protein